MIGLKLGFNSNVQRLSKLIVDLTTSISIYNKYLCYEFLNKMGLTYTKLLLSNPRKPALKPIETKALVDSGAVMLCIPDHFRIQLELEDEPNSSREISMADGRTAKVPYAGPIKVEWEDRICYVGALVVGDEPLLGAVPMEDMDLVLHPLSQKLMANPLSPNFPHHKIK